MAELTEDWGAGAGSTLLWGNWEGCASAFLPWTGQCQRCQAPCSLTPSLATMFLLLGGITGLCLPQDLAAHRPGRDNSHKSGRCLPACGWTLSSARGECKLSPGPRGCFRVNQREGSGRQLGLSLPWPERQTAGRG